MNKMTRFGLFALVSLLAGCSSAPHQSNDYSAPTAVSTAPAPVKSKISSTTVAANEVLIQAMGLVGTPYLWGGEDPRIGFDCSGLIQHVFSEAIDLNLPRTSVAMSTLNAPVVGREKLKTGDLLFFATERTKRITHVAIYVGENRFIHAPRAGKNVSMARLDNQYWSKHFVSAKRVITPTRLNQVTKQTGESSMASL
ncbi:C40 family peptidase [Pseudomonas serbica]|uniref:C40 family peptidase n=1 Tax=Pseudomonas serbica TaxID=2965074 RepID=UPI00237C3B59|nr:C40 family peptidase [Pseudomonas serbica]